MYLRETLIHYTGIMVDFSIATLFYYDSVVVLLLCDYQSAITPVSIFVVPCIPPRIYK